MQRQVPVWIPKTQPRPHRRIKVIVEAKFVDARGTAIAGTSASVTLYFRLGAEGTGEAGGLGSESSTEGVGVTERRKGSRGLYGVHRISRCRELRDSNMKSDFGGAPLVCTLPHVRRRQSLLLSRISSGSSLPSSQTDARSQAPGCNAREGQGTIGGFWHILTLASDWAEQAREALDLFERLAAARLASSVRVLISGPFADIVAEWIYERQRVAESMCCGSSGGIPSGDADQGGGCGDTVWKRVQVRLWQDTRGATRLEYQSSFLSDLLESLRRHAFDLVWVTSTGLSGLPGAAGSWHRGAEGPPHPAAYDLQSVWSVLRHPGACLDALTGEDISQSGFRGKAGDVCASCVRLHPVVHLDCHSFWASTWHLLSLMPPTKIVERELYTLHHDLMASDWVANAWNVHLLHDVSVHQVDAQGFDDPIVASGGRHELDGEGRVLEQKWRRSGLEEEDGAQGSGGSQDCVDSEGTRGEDCRKGCRSVHDADSQGRKVVQERDERGDGDPRANVLSFWSPGYMEHTSQLAILVQTEIDIDAAGQRVRTAAEDTRLQAAQQATHEQAHNPVGNAHGGGDAQGWGVNMFVRMLVYCKDSMGAFLEVHVPLPFSLGQKIASSDPEHAGTQRSGKAPRRGRNVLEVEVLLTQLLPHMHGSHGPMAEIDVVVSLFAARSGELRDEVYTDFPSADAMLRSAVEESVSEERHRRQSSDSTGSLEEIDVGHTLQAFLAHTSSQRLPDPLTPPLASARTRFVLHHGPRGSFTLPRPRAPSGTEVTSPRRNCCEPRFRACSCVQASSSNASPEAHACSLTS